MSHHSSNSTEHLNKEWTLLVYAFYKPNITTRTDSGEKCAHKFHCATCGCPESVSHWLDQKDGNSTRYLQKHAKKCWGEEVLAVADMLRSTKKACNGMKAYLYSGEQRMKLGQYHCLSDNMPTNKTHLSTSVEIVNWVSKSL
ncbi:uncharacterized protein C8Q71DRAFT_715993 [Rhodofomes roseus]|uniref:Uncharacterized protein n=1 Tax=Rhodofomes roseus TaxID=34475 RepID=A0ABQ8K2H9_9APHY|nr:uncharacterized protein C8Q71DRAFT_715993 [Rhodofomes roseus]KAH9830933.1 hypothetical protein C8Q71DRAFT_715993 [Rhodofomes roseus]